jgi:hypothetical protein
MLDSATWNHVICVAYADDQPAQIDLCAKNNQNPVYAEQLRV